MDDTRVNHVTSETSAPGNQGGLGSPRAHGGTAAEGSEIAEAAAALLAAFVVDGVYREDDG